MKSYISYTAVQSKDVDSFYRGVFAIAFANGVARDYEIKVSQYMNIGAELKAAIIAAADDLKLITII